MGTSAPLPGQAGRQRLKHLIARVETLPAPPAVATKILSLALDEDTDLKALSNLVESDPSLAIRVLKQASSAQHGHIESLSQAANLIGMSALRGILLGVAVRDCMILDPSSGDPLVKSLWRHCLAAAAAGQLLCEASHPRLAPLAFAAGLLHDCGRLTLCSLEPERFAEVFASCEARPVPLRELETQGFGADHCLVGKWLVESWSLPEVLRDSLWLHHQPVTALLSLGEKGRLPLITALADALAHEMLQDVGLPRAGLVARELALALSLEESEVDKVRSGMGERFAERADIFDLESDAATFYFQALQRANRKLAGSWLRLDSREAAIKRANAMLGAVSGCAAEISGADEAGEVAKQAARALREGSAAPSGAVYVFDRKAGFWQAYYFQGEATSKYRSGRLKNDCEVDPEDLNWLWPELAELLSGFGARSRALLSQAETRPMAVKGFHLAPLPCLGEIWGEVAVNFSEQPEQGVLEGLANLASLTGAALARLCLLNEARELAEDLADSNQAMQELNHKLIRTERLAAVGQLAAGAAHEINNPLAIVYARVQLLELRESDAQKKKSLRQMMEQIERISSIMNNLMDFARPAPPRFEPVNLTAILQKCLSLAQGGLEKLNIAAKLESQPGLPAIQGDPRQLEQVFLNLLLNAEHAMEKSGGSLGVWLGYAPESGKATVRVTDSGSGIPKENLPKIFDPFFTTKEEGRGTGLGLSTSHAIILAHHGEISVQSEEGRGTQVTVELPRDWRAGNEEPAPQPESEPLLASGILVVDDEPYIREILSETLKSRGYEVSCAADGKAALELIDQAKPALILLDIRMPLLGGLDLLRELKAREAGIPVLVLTGLAGPEEIEQALSLGAAGCIRKPFQVEALLDEVAKQLEAKPKS